MSSDHRTSSPNKKSKYLFEILLNAEEVSRMVTLGPDLLRQMLGRCGKKYRKTLTKSEKESCVFLANYKKIMESHSRRFANRDSIDLCLHFALLFSSYQLNSSDNKAARNILKQAAPYQESECDPMLMAISLSNLAFLTLREGKPNKALRSALQAASLLHDHLELLHQSRNKKQLQSDGVVFVNALAISRRALVQILSKPSHQQSLLRRMLQQVNRVGYTFCKKYLGQSSFFISKFTYNENSVCLPFYLPPEEESVQEPPKMHFEEQLVRQLQNICEIIKDMHVEPQAYVIREILLKSVEREPSIEVEKPPEPITPPTTPQSPHMKVRHVEALIIDSWSAEISFARDFTFAGDSFDYLGEVYISYTLGKIKKELRLSKTAFMAILNVINIYDVLPYEMELGRLNQTNLVRRLLYHYMKVDQVGTFFIFPRALSIIPAFKTKFMGQEAVIFLNHIRFRRFRIGIAPVGSTQTMYLEIDFKHSEVTHLYNLKELKSYPISMISQIYKGSQKCKGSAYEYADYKMITVHQQRVFQDKIKSIIWDFASFLLQMDQSELSSLTTSFNLEQSHSYYHYTEHEEGKGQFYQVRYRSNINLIQITTRNNFQTQSPQGAIYAKGNHLYTPSHFQRDFGMFMKSARKYLWAFAQLIVEKYTLRVFENPLNEEDEDRYDQNAILQAQLNSKCFKRKLMNLDNYLVVVTIQLVAVNSLKPLGLRVNAYEPVKCSQSGLFIYIVPQYWEKPTVEAEPFKGTDVKKSTDDYLFKKGYFLAPWLIQEGFDFIFGKLKVVNRMLEVEGCGSRRFLHIDQLL